MVDILTDINHIWLIFPVGLFLLYSRENLSRSFSSLPYLPLHHLLLPVTDNLFTSVHRIFDQAVPFCFITTPPEWSRFTLSHTKYCPLFA